MASFASLRSRYADAVRDLDFYTAEQTCRTLSHRLRTSREGEIENLKEESREVLFQGACMLLQNEQIHSGTALSLDFVATSREDKVNFNDAKEKLVNLMEQFKEDLPPQEANEKLRILKAGIEFSKSESIDRNYKGDMDLNTLAAKCSWKVGNFATAQEYFLASNDPESFASMLMEWNTRFGLRSESELFLARAVLEYALLRQLDDARVIYKAFVETLGSGFAPLANFCGMLLTALSRADAYPLFQKLCDAYGPSLQRDPSLNRRLTGIARMYYNVAPPQDMSNPLQQMMSGMMKNLLGGGPSVTR